MSETAPLRMDWTSDGEYEDAAIPGCEDFEHIAGLLGADWEWDQLDVYYSPSRRRYFWVEQSGCSCDGPWEYIDSIDDFQSGMYADAKKQVLDYDSPFWLSGEGETQKNEALSSLQKHNAAQRRKEAA